MSVVFVKFLKSGGAIKLAGLMPKTLLLCIALTTAALAQPNSSQNLLVCSAIESSAERLTCYDDLARSAAPSASKSSDNWRIRTEVDPIDDSTNIFILTEATDESSTSAYGDLPYLYLRCLQGKVAALIEWQEYLGLDTIQTTYRIGSASAITDTWYIASTNKAAFYSRNEPATLEFINKLVNADSATFIAQTTPYGEPIKTAIFNIANLDQIIDQLYEACDQ